MVDGSRNSDKRGAVNKLMDEQINDRRTQETWQFTRRSSGLLEGIIRRFRSQDERGCLETGGEERACVPSSRVLGWDQTGERQSLNKLRRRSIFDAALIWFGRARTSYPR